MSKNFRQTYLGPKGFERKSCHQVYGKVRKQELHGKLVSRHPNAYESKPKQTRERMGENNSSGTLEVCVCMFSL